MAVLARASITLAQTVDITGYYRFYKLQSSTAAVPAKPTSITTLPPSGWSATEPSYTEGSTNSLYFVDLTKYSDGTFEYSDVSLASSYEAAKQAYNKSVLALENLENLQIGGRNLFLNTNIPDAAAAKRPKLIDQVENTTVNGTAYVVEHGIGTRVTSAMRPVIRFGANGNGSITPTMNGLEAGQTYTLSFDCNWKVISAASSGTTTTMTAYLYDDRGTQGTLTWRRIQEFGTATAGVEGTARCEGTFTFPDNVTMCFLYIAPGNSTSSNYASGDYIELCNLKLEKGQKATAWTPAPEDIFDAIDGKSTIYYGTPAATYSNVEIGDYLVDSTDGSTYRWSGSAWVTMTDYATAINNIEIGGKNMLTGTNTVTELTATGTWAKRTWREAGSGTGTITSLSVSDSPDKSITKGWQFDVTNVAGTAYSQALCIGQNAVKIAAGKQYTISCYAKGSGQLFMFSGITSYIGGRHTVTSEWQRYSTTFVTGTTTAYVNANGSNVYFAASETGASIAICGMRFEEGSKATAWTPAPEDINAQISDVAGRTAEYIKGTQTAATRFWTGVSNTLTELKEGTQIAYCLPYAYASETAASKGITADELVPAETITTKYNNDWLNLTLADGTNTGWVPCYYGGTTRMTSHYGANNVIHLTYRENVTSAIPRGWWGDANYDSTVIDRVRYTVSLTATAAIAAGLIGVINSSGKIIKLAASVAFDMTKPILYIGTAYTETALTQTNNYICFGAPFKLTSTHTITGAAAGKAVYIVGSISGAMFTPNSTVLTCTVPQQEDNLYYIRLGYMNTAANAVLEAEHPIFAYINGSFQRIDRGAAAIATATKQYFWHDDNGAHVGTVEGNGDSGYNSLWNSNGMLLRKDQNILAAYKTDSVDFYDGDGNAEENIVASFGENSRIGKKDGVHMEVESDRMVGVGELGETFFEIDANGAEREGEPLIYGLSPWNQYATYGSPQTWHFALGTLGLTVGKSFKVSWGAGKAYVQYGQIQFTYGTSSTKTATVNGVSVSVAYTYNATTGNSLKLTITSSSSSGGFRLARIEVTADYKTPTFKFGTSDGDRGAYSSSFGEGITNIDEDAMVIGRYNDPDIERDSGDGSPLRLLGNPLFVVGNGSDENNRSNAFRVHEEASVVEGDLIVTGSINNGRVITSIQTVSANVNSIAVGATANATIDISGYDYASPPIVIPYSTGWLTTVAPSSVSSTSITGVVWNFSNGSHSGTCQYLLIVLSEVEE